jgi:hypothetical protein
VGELGGATAFFFFLLLVMCFYSILFSFRDRGATV